MNTNEAHQQQQKIKLAYWDYKGEGEQIRLLLSYLKIPYEEISPETQETWKSLSEEELKSSGFHFPNLPYIIDGDIKITESGAIPFYLCHKFNRPELTGKNIEDKMVVRKIHDIVEEIRIGIMKVIFKPDFTEKLEDLAREGSNVENNVKLLSRYLGSKKFILDYFTIADLEIAYFIDMMRVILNSAGVENFFFKRENLKTLYQSVFELDGIRDHLNSEKWKRPIVPRELLPWIQYDE